MAGCQRLSCAPQLPQTHCNSTLEQLRINSSSGSAPGSLPHDAKKETSALKQRCVRQSTWPPQNLAKNQVKNTPGTMLSTGTQACAAKTGSAKMSSLYTTTRRMARGDMCTVNENVWFHTGHSASPSVCERCLGSVLVLRDYLHTGHSASPSVGVRCLAFISS